jgi:hypothetical protein
VHLIGTRKPRPLYLLSSDSISVKWNWRGAFQSPPPWMVGEEPQHWVHTQDEASKYPTPSGGLLVSTWYHAYCRAGDGFPSRGCAFEATTRFQQTASASKHRQSLTSLPSSNTSPPPSTKAMLLSVKCQLLIGILGSWMPPGSE